MVPDHFRASLDNATHFRIFTSCAGTEDAPPEMFYGWHQSNNKHFRHPAGPSYLLQHQPLRFCTHGFAIANLSTADAFRLVVSHRPILDDVALGALFLFFSPLVLEVSSAKICFTCSACTALQSVQKSYKETTESVVLKVLNMFIILRLGAQLICNSEYSYLPIKLRR